MKIIILSKSLPIVLRDVEGILKHTCSYIRFSNVVVLGLESLLVIELLVLGLLLGIDIGLRI